MGLNQQFLQKHRKILERLEERGILRYVYEFRKIRDDLAGKLQELRAIGVNVNKYEQELNEIRKQAPLAAREIRKSDEAFLREIKRHIERMSKIMVEILKLKKEIKQIKEHLEKLEKYRETGEIPETAYMKLKEEYQEKLRRLSEGIFETEVRTKVKKQE